MKRQELMHVSIYLYGLNDNIRNLGNASKKLSQGLVIYSLFNRQRRKFRNRTRRRNKNNVHNEQIKECVRELLLTYKTPSFSKSIHTYIQCVPVGNYSLCCVLLKSFY